jgi:hypothetical protein
MPERQNYQQVLLVERLRGAIARLIDWTELGNSEWLLTRPLLRFRRPCVFCGIDVNLPES